MQCRSTRLRREFLVQELCHRSPCRYPRAAVRSIRRVRQLCCWTDHSNHRVAISRPRAWKVKMPYHHALMLAATLCLTLSSAVQADCDGRDLFPALKSEAPAAYAAVETAASTIPFRHGKLFRLSRAGSEPSFAGLALPRSAQASPLAWR